MKTQPRDLAFYAQAIRHGSTSPAEWITDARAVTEAQRAARHAAEDSRRQASETSVVLETIAYGLIVLLVALLAVLAVTPS